MPHRKSAGSTATSNLIWGAASLPARAQRLIETSPRPGAASRPGDTMGNAGTGIGAEPPPARRGTLGPMGSDDKPKGADEATRAMALRATATAQRLKDVAARGGPAIDQLSARVHGRLKDVPEERIQPPPANIEAPTALQYVLLGDGPDMAQLREFFENLLATSMDRDTTASAHPAFVSMIAQLTPDRDVYAYFDLPGGLQTVLGAGIGINESKVDFYISNLVRLGIIQLHTGGAGERSDAPAELSQLVSSRFPVADVGVHTALQFLLFMRVTPLGQQFLDACVRPRAR
jgi:hypothetical protein